MKKYSVIAFVVLLLSAGVLVWLNQARDGQVLTVSSDPADLQMTLSLINEGDHETSEAIKIVSDRPVRLQKGTYLLEVMATKDTQGHLQNITLNDKPIRVELRPDYSQSKLESLLASEGREVIKELERRYPEQMALMTLVEEKLHKRGQWYTALLVPKNLNQFDIYRIVLKKEPSWKLITVPPELVISKQDFPDIPREVLTDLNSRVPRL